MPTAIGVSDDGGALHGIIASPNINGARDKLPRAPTTSRPSPITSGDRNKPSLVSAHLPSRQRRSRATNPPSRITPPPSISGARDKSPITDTSTSQHQRSMRQILGQPIMKYPPPNISGAYDECRTAHHGYLHLPTPAEHTKNPGQPITDNSPPNISGACKKSWAAHHRCLHLPTSASTRQNPIASSRPAHHG